MQTNKIVAQHDDEPNEIVGTPTPGPWTVNTIVSTNGTVTYIKADTGHIEVAVIYGGGAQHLANAQLISAAPALLAALKAIRAEDDLYFATDSGSEHEGWRSDERIALWVAVDVAIARAEGRS
jgi:hypothetical protein